MFFVCVTQGTLSQGDNFVFDTQTGNEQRGKLRKETGTPLCTTVPPITEST